MDTNLIKAALSSLTALKKVKEGGGLFELGAVLTALNGGDGFSFIEAYSRYMSRLLKGGSLARLVAQSVLLDDNIFARQSVACPFEELDQALIEAAEHDAAALCLITESCDPKALLLEGAQRFGELKKLILALPSLIKKESLPFASARELYQYYRKNGYGYFASAHAFACRGGEVVPVSLPDPIRLFELKGYELQKEAILSNTRLLIAGKEANNLLLYGDKGTGKSSTVKAVATEYCDKGLKIIELFKDSYGFFPTLCDMIAKSPYKFIVFLDDLSFSSEDDSFSALKAVMEGGVSGRPVNAVIYATSNRRHLVRESFSQREGDDIHVRDTIETVTSLADRFGVEIIFNVPDRDEYLMIVEKLSEEAGLNMEKNELYLMAERFALLKGGRSPRTARQLITDLSAKRL